MSRLADYFVVVGFDHDKERSGLSSGKILQRFPEKDWDDTPFIDGIELFCQPQGWNLSTVRQQPTFFVSVLTDIDANRHYCACLSFNEPVAITPCQPPDEEGEEEAVESTGGLVQHHSIMYAPKCLVLVSRLDYFSTFRNCLGIIYTVYIDNISVQMETLIGNILGCVQVPPPGGPQVRFSIGAGDRQALQPPLYSTIPVTGTTVYQLFEQLDVIVVDLDGGSLLVPECINVSRLPEPLHSILYSHMCEVLRPELKSADDAFPPGRIKFSESCLLDKNIRAIFLRTFAQLLQGYRSCLTIIRIHPRPFITFHKAAFLGQQPYSDCDFIIKVLDCMFFNTFVSERGPPYRACDIFDEIYASMQDILKAETKDTSLVLPHIEELGTQLNKNEIPNPQQYVQKIPKPTEGAFTRIHQPTFPMIDAKVVQDIIDEGMSNQSLRAKLSAIKPEQPRIVPMGPQASSWLDNRSLVTNSARRLEVLRSCVNCIFENKISDARKTFPAVLRALKNKTARLALTQELALHVTGNKAMLEHQQFDLVVRLMNCALQDDSSMDEYGVAAAILPLAMAFCRKLCTGVIQFAYTCIQDHPVWQNQQFWEAAFYQDVQRDIRALYVPNRGSSGDRESSLSPVNTRESKELVNAWNRNEHRTSSSYSNNEVNNLGRQPEHSALEIAAEQMRLWPNLSLEQQKELMNNEESTVYSQAIHYANRMVALRVPLDVSKSAKNANDLERESNSNSNVTNSMAETDSADAESGFEEDTSEVGASVIKFVSRFVDKVCTDSGVTENHIKALHQMIPGVVAMQMETLEAVHKESKRLPPITKLVKIAFDEEVTSENIETFRKLISRVRCPPSVFHVFAFSGHLAVPQTPLHKQKEKNATLKVIAKKTLLKTAMRAGFKPKPSSRKQKYVIQGPHDSRTLPSPGRTPSIGFDSESDRPSSLYEDDLSMIEEGDLALSTPHIPTYAQHMDSKTLEKLSERSYCKDFQRLGLGVLNGTNNKSKSEGFRISSVNSAYSVCRSYPALLVVPQIISDESVRKICRCHRHGRFPVITWRHPRTKSLLLRASCFMGKVLLAC
ncbi:Myotubularin-related protein 13 like protein [Argiope bruennichi]|uniref:Myotubularin-related protein 13 like protein n=1 Tax=Argiope bruennichi TaxID=94029 RepID=A0A8T0E3Z7_ARGBR|nr:Myotubularin-related protein 13 like protein [Argiope bruennichi]